MATLETATPDITLLSAVRRVLEACLKDLLGVGVWGKLELEVLVSSEWVDESWLG